MSVTASGLPIRSLDESIADVEPYLSPLLFPDNNINRIRWVAAHVPAALVRVFGFECRIDADATASDLLFLADIASGGRKILASGGMIPDGLESLPAWRAINRFVETWATPDSPLFYGADDAWFEFDMGSDAPFSMPPPSFFFGPKVARFEGASPDDSERRAQRESVQIILHGIALLRGHPFALRDAKRVEQIIEALPTVARVYQVGLMLSRPEQALRLCVTNISRAGILPYLKGIGWNGASAELGALIDCLAPVAGSIKLTFDLGRSMEVGSKIGLECYPTPHWDAFLDTLMKDGLCTKSKQRALLGFSGILPKSAEPLAALFPGHAPQAQTRWLHHVKVTYEQSKPTGAKAYLAVRGCQPR